MMAASLGIVFLLAAVVSGAIQTDFVLQKQNDGSTVVIVQGVPGVRRVTVTLAGQTWITEVELDETKAGTWQINIPQSNSLQLEGADYYFIEYYFDKLAYMKKGTFSRSDPAVIAPVSPRHLVRRATTVFFDDFSSGKIDTSKWHYAITGDGGGNHEFNMYTPEAANCYIKNHELYIRPTLTEDHFGANFLSKGDLDIKATWGSCTDNARNGCHRTGVGNIPVTMSCKISTVAAIRYGKIEVVAKLSKGDWLWPAIWLLPTGWHYGGWPASGEIDIIEARGNTNYHSPEGWTNGIDQVVGTIHYGPSWDHKRSHSGQNTLHGTSFADGYHTFWIDWTANYIKLGVDSTTFLAFNTPSQGYWKEGGFSGTNVWSGGGKDAPFDQPFHLILNVAVGGDYFNSRIKNLPYAQPWHDDWQDSKMTEFWNARAQWLATWHGEDVATKVKSVKMVQY